MENRAWFLVTIGVFVIVASQVLLEFKKDSRRVERREARRDRADKVLEGCAQLSDALKDRAAETVSPEDLRMALEIFRSGHREWERAIDDLSRDTPTSYGLPLMLIIVVLLGVMAAVDSKVPPKAGVELERLKAQLQEQLDQAIQEKRQTTRSEEPQG